MITLCTNSLLPTRESNILDLLITNPPEQVSIFDICDPKEVGMSSDHRVVRSKVLSLVNSTKQPKRLVFDHRRADLEGLRNSLTEPDICSLLSSNEKQSTIDDDWSVWKNTVLSAVYKYIPTFSSLFLQRRDFSSLGTTLQVNPKRFWSVFNTESSSRSIPTSVPTPDPNNPENRLYTYTTSSIAKMFNEYFHSTYTPS